MIIDDIMFELEQQLDKTAKTKPTLQPSYELFAPVDEWNISARSIPLTQDAIIVNAFEEDKKMLAEKRRAIEVGDIIEEAHPEKNTINVGDAPDGSGIVENQNQQQAKIKNIVFRMPTGFNYHKMACLDALAHVASSLDKKGSHKATVLVDQVIGQIAKMALEIDTESPPDGSSQTKPYIPGEKPSVPKPVPLPEAVTPPGGHAAQRQTQVYPEAVGRERGNTQRYPEAKVKQNPNFEARVSPVPVMDNGSISHLENEGRGSGNRSTTDDLFSNTGQNTKPGKPVVSPDAATKQKPGTSSAPDMSASQMAGITNTPAVPGGTATPGATSPHAAPAAQVANNVAQKVAPIATPGVLGWLKNFTSSKPGKYGLIVAALAAVAGGAYLLWSKYHTSIESLLNDLAGHEKTEVKQLVTQARTQLVDINAALQQKKFDDETTNAIHALETTVAQIDQSIIAQDPAKEKSMKLVQLVHEFTVQVSSQAKTALEEHGAKIGPTTNQERFEGMNKFIVQRMPELETDDLEDSLIGFIDAFRDKTGTSPKTLTISNLMNTGTREKLEQLYDIMRNPQRYAA